MLISYQKLDWGKFINIISNDLFNPLDLPSQVPFHFPSDDKKGRTMNIHMKN